MDRQFVPTNDRIYAARELTKASCALRSFLRAHEYRPSGTYFVGEAPLGFELRGIIINSRRPHRAANSGNLGCLNLKVTVGQDDHLQWRLGCGGVACSRKQLGDAVETARKSNGWSRSPALRFGEAVVPAAPAKRVLLACALPWIELEYSACVVVQSADQIWVQLVGDLGLVQHAPHQLPMLLAIGTEVVGDARRTQFQCRVHISFAVQQPKRVSLQALLGLLR